MPDALGQGLFQLGLHALAALLIAIESSTTDPELLRAMLDSCVEAHGAGSCVAAADVGDERADWHAKVSWEGADGRRARIEIRRGTADAEPEHVRVVTFAATDAQAQRHRAVGLIVAAYVAEHTEGEAEAAEPPRPPAPKPASDPGDEAKPSVPSAPEQKEPAAETETQPEPADEEAEPSARFEAESEALSSIADTRPPALGVDLALLAGPALDHGPPRLGVALRGFLRPDAWPLGVIIALRGARRLPADGDDAKTSLLFASGTAGALLRLQAVGSRLALELRGELLAERVQASAEAPLTQRSAADGRWRLGGQLGIEGHLALGSGFGLLLGGEASLLVPAVSLDVAGQNLGRAAPLGVSGVLGLRWAR